MDMIHLKAPGQWMNDPNGFIYYKGEYHLFYQYFPYEPRWGTMHWGHAVSTDLVHWEHRGIALFPSKYNDRNGCFSGSAIEHDGRMYVYYTGVRYLEENPEDIHLCQYERFISAQMMITSDDGIHFDNIHGKKTIISPVDNPMTGCKTHMRDPKVWKGKDGWYMVIGTRTTEDKGKLLFYKSQNLYQWDYVNDVTKDENFGWMWECPDYFETDGQQVLVFSPMGILKDGKKIEDHAICTIVDFEEESCSMNIPDEYQYFDYGLDLYAAQSTTDEQGRRVIVAWARMPETAKGNWIGMFCAPRLVEVKDGHIYFRVHPNIKEAFSRAIQSPKEAGKGGYRLILKLLEGEELNIGGYRIFRKNGRIHTDRRKVFRQHEDYRMEFETPEVKGGYELDIYVDPNLIEVYVNNGEYVITNTVYDLGDEIETTDPKKVQLFTMEEM